MSMAIDYTKFVYTLFVKNVTISLPDEVLDKLRQRARESEKSLNAWLRDLLTREVAPADQDWQEFRRIAKEIREEQANRLRPDWKWNREEIYEDRPKGFR
jgi:plasmid stability protein